MLNGIAPIFLFNFYKNISDDSEESPSGIPILSNLGFNRLSLPPIPIYLDEKLSGIYVDSQKKDIDIETEIEAKKTTTSSEDKEPFVTQRPLNSSTTIELVANSSSIGLVIISALMDIILPMVESKEYSITYLNGAVTLFNAKLKTFSISQTSDNTLYRVSITLANYSKKTAPLSGIPLVGRITGATPL